jgi:hypothetical protein
MMHQLGNFKQEFVKYFGYFALVYTKLNKKLDTSILKTILNATTCL